MKNILTILVLIFVPLGMLFALIELAIYVNTLSAWIMLMGLGCLIVLATIEIYERSK